LLLLLLFLSPLPAALESVTAMSNQSPLLENVIQLSYHSENLPPLWQVIYQEAIRGHHLLFHPTHVERYEIAVNSPSFWLDESLTDELETVVVQIVSCSDLQDMVRVIDALPDSQRQSLYFLYRRVLWTWRNYVKDQLN